MKRQVVVVATVLALVALIVVPVIAAAQKAGLVPCPINYPGPTLPPGGGFVVFNNSAGPNNLEMTLSLKGVSPNADYDIYVFVDGAWLGGDKVGTVTTNKQGNANLHLNAAVSTGSHVLNVDVTSAGSFADVYELPGIHTGDGVTMDFK
jgi:hypothetical protein